jgi:hypothetical protein
MQNLHDFGSDFEARSLAQKLLVGNKACRCFIDLPGASLQEFQYVSFWLELVDAFGL